MIDDGINDSNMRLVHGIEVTVEQASLDVSAQVCHGEGHFLGTQQSLNLKNSDYDYTRTGDRPRRADWEADGGLDMWERARQEARKILGTYQPTPISLEFDAAIREGLEVLRS